jgi:hypothetical protein
VGPEQKQAVTEQERAMQQSQDGYLLIADITGYTAFLRESELEHAKDSLRSLLDLLIEQTKPPLRISRLEGDAVISYAPQGSFQRGQTLVELIEATYVEFRRALDLMVLNTTCNCLACRNISNLDLKFFVHYGTYALEALPAYTELIGTDVNLIHRLTKNTVTEKTGIHAYVLYTQAAVKQLDIPGMENNLQVHVESYDDIGEVTSYLLDMHPIWEDMKHRYHTIVEPEDAIFILERSYKLPVPVVWEYFTNPKYRAILYGSDKQELKELKQGRVDNGSVYVCSHGKNQVQQTIVDWHPFDQYTIKNRVPGGGITLTTICLKQEHDETTVNLLAGKVEQGPALLRGMLNRFGSKMVLSTVEEGFEAFNELIEAEMADSNYSDLQTKEIPAEQIEDALAKSLAEV